MPNLLIDGRTLTSTPKGVGRYTYHLCCELDRLLSKDWEMNILVNTPTLPSFPPTFRGNFVKIDAVSEFKTGFKIIAKQIKLLKSQILVRPTETIGSGYGIPMLTICHDINEWIAEIQASQGQPRNIARKVVDKIKSHYVGKGLRQSEYVLCNSEFIRKATSTYYGVNYHRTQLAYCGVDPRFYQLSREINAEAVKRKYKIDHFILTFATGDYRENFFQLPAVIKGIKKTGIQTTFVIAGVREEEKYYKELQSRFRQLNLIEGKDYIFEGFLDENKFINLVELYTAADFYLELSLHEGFGMQVIEAMSCGTTCISSDKGALREIAGDHAILISDPTNPDLIIEAIQFAYENNLHLRSNENQIAYTKKFAWEYMGLTLRDCLIQIAKNENLIK